MLTLKPDRGASLDGCGAGFSRGGIHVELVAAKLGRRDICNLHPLVVSVSMGERHGGDGTDRSIGIVVLRLADVQPIRKSRPVRDEVRERVCMPANGRCMNAGAQRRRPTMSCDELRGEHRENGEDVLHPEIRIPGSS